MACWLVSPSSPTGNNRRVELAGLEPIEPLPVFERRLWREDEADKSLLPIMKHLGQAGTLPEMFQLFGSWQNTHEQLSVRFSGDRLAKLRELAGGNTVTIQDSLSAYLIFTLNNHCYLNDDRKRILRANTVVNFRGVSDSIASLGHVFNANSRNYLKMLYDFYLYTNNKQCIFR